MNGSKVIYKCFNGYELNDGDKELVCINGDWIGKVPSCVKSMSFCKFFWETKNFKNLKITVNCGYPGSIENGKVLYIGTLGEYNYHPYMTSSTQNRQIKYVCDRGKEENSFKIIHEK